MPRPLLTKIKSQLSFRRNSGKQTKEKKLSSSRGSDKGSSVGGSVHSVTRRLSYDEGFVHTSNSNSVRSCNIQRRKSSEGKNSSSTTNKRDLLSRRSSGILSSSANKGGSDDAHNKFIKLVLKQRWSDVLQYLSDHTGHPSMVGGSSSVLLGTKDQREMSYIYMSYPNFHLGNILHIMCEHHPPVRVVHRVASLFPMLTIQRNNLNQTPLHIAAAKGASHKVISSLLKHGGTQQALWQDNKGRTPLHSHVKGCTPSVRICDPGSYQQPYCDLSAAGTLHNVSDSDHGSSVGGSGHTRRASIGSYYSTTSVKSANGHSAHRRSIAGVAGSTVGSNNASTGTGGGFTSPGMSSPTGSNISNSNHTNICRGALTSQDLLYGPDLKVMRLLAEAGPQAIHIKNFEGRSPMMIANAVEEQNLLLQEQQEAEAALLAASTHSDTSNSLTAASSALLSKTSKSVRRLSAVVTGESTFTASGTESSSSATAALSDRRGGRPMLQKGHSMSVLMGGGNKLRRGSLRDITLKAMSLTSPSSAAAMKATAEEDVDAEEKEETLAEATPPLGDSLQRQVQRRGSIRSLTDLPSPPQTFLDCSAGDLKNDIECF